jgi:hypothetical protein
MKCPDLNKIWTDPVWSKVIAAGFIFIFSQLFVLIWSFIKNLEFFEVYKNFFHYLGIERKKLVKKFNDISKLKILSNKDIPSKITIAPTVFFHYRFCDAFPGLEPRYTWFTSKKDIHTRLKILLSRPILFKTSEGHGTTSDPIWWFRGHSALYIENFTILNRNKCLLNVDELIIDRIAAVRGRSYYEDFVYIECSPDKPIGLYKHDKELIKDIFETDGEYKEEYGIYKFKKITIREYEDGAAIIRGKPKPIENARLRVRNLAKYNFIISSKFSPYNCDKFSRDSKFYFLGLLKNTITFDQFIDWMNTITKNRLDF